MKDKQGRTYANLSELKAGDKIELDDGFTCARPHSIHEVKGEKDSLYFECDVGNHMLDGQLNYRWKKSNDALVGVYLAEVKE